MIVATITVSTGRFHYEQRHVIQFDNLEKAETEYKRVAEMLIRRNDRTNDLPKTIEIDGASGTKLTVGMDDISSLALQDFALADAHEKGLADSYPNLFKRPRV